MKQKSDLAYHTMSDDEVVKLCKNGDTDALNYLINKYKNYVTARARAYFLMGADKEDIVQEGMIGLYKAIRDFQDDRQASFRSFAELCITRQMITAIKAALRQKHIPLNSYVSLNRPVYEEESDRTLLDILSESRTFDPEEMVINKEEYASMGTEMSKILSELELIVLSSYLEGKSYQEIADHLGKQVKSIDNALQRIKRKMGKFLEETAVSM